MHFECSEVGLESGALGHLVGVTTPRVQAQLHWNGWDVGLLGKGAHNLRA